MPGRFFNEWAVGDRIVHQPSRTVTETDNLMFSAMTHNMQPLHLDAEYAKASEFGQILVNSTFTFSLAVGLSIADTTVGTLVANLGFGLARTLFGKERRLVGKAGRVPTRRVDVVEVRSLDSGYGRSLARKLIERENFGVLSFIR